jgi:molybdopterin synthase sulfur carrier subunit
VSITVRIPATLRPYTEGRQVIEGTGATFHDLLHDLDNRYPGLRNRVLTRNGALHPFVRLRINNDARSLREPRTELTDGDAVTLQPAVDGGLLGFTVAAALLNALA